MKTKRFIAGVNCPKCGQVDAIRWWQADQKEFVECVECDFFANDVEKFDQKPETIKNKIIWLDKT